MTATVLLGTEAFHLIADALPEAMVLTDRHGSVRAANRAARTFFGADGVPTCLDAVLAEPAARLEAFLQRCGAAGARTEETFTFQRPAGPERRRCEGSAATTGLLLRWSTEPPAGEGNSASGDRAGGDQAQRLLEALLESTRDAVWIKDERGRYLRINSAGLRMVNRRSAAEVIGRDDSTLFSLATARQIMTDDRQAMRGGVTHGFYEYSLQHQGVACDYVITRSAFRDAAGKVAGVVGFGRDVTEANQAEAIRAEAERRLRDTLENARLVAVMLDGRGRVTFINDFLLELTGYTRDEVLGQDYFTRFLSPRLEPTVRQVFEKVQAGDPLAATFENPIVTRAGVERTVAWNNIALRDPAGKVIGISSIGEDVTERRRVEAALQDSEARFRFALESALVGTWDLDLVTGRVRWSDNAASLHGLPPGGMPDSYDGYFALVHPEDREETRKMIDREIARQDKYEVDYRIVRPDGAVRWLTARGRSVAAGGGRERRAVGVVLDSTARREAREAVRERERQLRALFDGALNALAIFDDGQRFLDVNPTACALFGLSREQLIGRRFDEFTTAAPAGGGEASFLGQKRRDGRRYTGEVRITRADGSPRDLEFLATSNFLPGHHLADFRDVTEKRQLEIQFRQAQKMEAVGRLAGGIAHDFNNLLTVINGCSEFALNHLADDSAARPLIKEVYKAGERASGLTRQLLAFSRQQVLSPRVFSLNDLLGDLDKMIPRMIGEDVELVLDLTPVLGKVKADPGLFEQVVLNLAVNARDAMPHGGTLHIATRAAEVKGGATDVGGKADGVPDGRYVQLSVGDTGTGMNDSIVARIFEPFFTTKAEGRGTGLGLAMAYGTVMQSGGHITVESAVGRGTTFRIYLPPVAEEAAPRAESPNPMALPGGRETILLVEDEAAVRGMAALVLRSVGYHVLEAAEGVAALRAAAEYEGTIDLVLTDVVMPRMRGRALTEQLVVTRPGIKVMFMSGYTDDAVVRQGIVDKDLYFLQKPFTPTVLARTVRDVLDGAEQL